jgi:hypothetical protein
MSVTFRRPLLGTALVATLVAALPTALLADHDWNGYHWARSSNPVTLGLGDNLTALWKPHLSLASRDWSASSVINTAVVAGASKGKNCRPDAGRIEVCNARYGNTGWLGIAQVWVSGRHITQGSVKMNDTYFSTPSYNTSAWRQFVVCQEVGHVFGLDHQDEDFDNAPLGTCMDYTSDPEPNQHPNAHDYAELESLYGHTDGAAAAVPDDDTRGRAGQGQIEDLDDPSQWGRLMRSKRGGKGQTFERDLGNGRKVFTFVIWA